MQSMECTGAEKKPNQSVREGKDELSANGINSQPQMAARNDALLSAYASCTSGSSSDERMQVEASTTLTHRPVGPTSGSTSQKRGRTSDDVAVYGYECNMPKVKRVRFAQTASSPGSEPDSSLPADAPLSSLQTGGFRAPAGGSVSHPVADGSAFTTKQNEEEDVDLAQLEDEREQHLQQQLLERIARLRKRIGDDRKSS